MLGRGSYVPCGENAGNNTDEKTQSTTSLAYVAGPALGFLLLLQKRVVAVLAESQPKPPFS